MYIAWLLQLLLRLGGRAESVLELCLLLLDEQRLEISSPWAASEDKSIVENLWPKLYDGWMEKERWSGIWMYGVDTGRAKGMGHSSALLESVYSMGV